MNYLSQMPQEIKCVIFSYLYPAYIVKLYSYGDIEYNSIFEKSSFWYIKFKNENLPILRNNTQYCSWLSEYLHVTKTVEHTKKVMSKYLVKQERLNCPIGKIINLEDVFTGLNINWSLFNELYNESKSLEFRGVSIRRNYYIEIYFDKSNGVYTAEFVSEESSKGKIVLTNKFDDVYNIIFKLIYHGYYEII